MKLLRRLDARSAFRCGMDSSRGFVAAIGGFDGIHRGHRALLDHACRVARDTGCASMILTFEPLPKEFFARAHPPARLTTFRERWRLLEGNGPDVFCALHFDARLRGVDAHGFVQQMQDGGVRSIVIGPDFRAGFQGEANTQWLQVHGPALGLDVQVVAPVMGEGMRVSSGAIRNALVAGDLQLAARLLGRPYSMRGRVVLGAQLGRSLGYPTANLRLARRQTPMDGIFAVRVRGAGMPGTGNVALGGVASLGTRPTVGGTKPLLEAHIFDFDADLYGREIEVEFVHRLRDEVFFDSVPLMVEQMHRDAAEARAVLAMNPLDA
jgi:riboflavin kinase/FMN adenylyltransferase